MANIKKKSSNKKVTYVKNKAEEFFDYFQERHKPISEEYIKSIAMDLIEWSEDESNMRLSAFWRRYPWPRTQFYRWINNHEILKEAYEVARNKMADNRERKATEDPRYFPVYARNQIIYDYDYRDALQWRESIKPKGQEGGATTVNVVLPEYESSPMVPDKNIHGSD